MLKSARPLPALKYYIKRTYVTSATCLPAFGGDENTNVSILPNGVRVASEYQPTPISCMSLFIEAGPRFETACNNGITHFLEHMAYKGFYGMNRCQLEYDLMMIGAKMTAKTSREIQSFTGLFPSECAPSIADKLVRIITDLELNCCEIENEKYNVCLEMVDEENDPRAVVFDYLHQTAFQGTPLAQRVIGPTWNVKKFDREFARNFLLNHYQPYKLCVCASGKIKHEEFVLLIERGLGHLVGEPAFESDEGPSRYTGSQVIYRDDSMPFAHVAIAVEAPGYNSPEYYPALIASQMIGSWHKSQGGGIGHASNLAKAVACDGMAESFQSFYITYRDIGLWGIYFVATKMNLEDMVENIMYQWMNLCITTPSSNLERAVNLAKLKCAHDMNGVLNNCHDIGTQMLYSCARKSIQTKFHKLSSMKEGNIRECAENMLYDRCPVVAAVGPTENLPDYTRIRSGMYWLRF